MEKIIALFIVYISFSVSAFTQNLKSLAEKDWDYFLANRTKLCQTIEECNNIPNLSLLEYSKFIDKAYAKRSQMAKAFLESYPDDIHYQEALDWFLNMYFQPLFIPENLSDSRVELLSGFPKDVRSGPKVSEFYRFLPIDKQAKEQWVNTGNELVAKVLKSDVSLERKADVEIRLLIRDFNIAKRWYDALPKKQMETDYWEEFDMQYWDSFQLRLFTLLDKYPDYVPLARFIQYLFEETLKLRSPELSELYMRKFLSKTGKTNPLADKPGIKALHNLLNDYLEVKKNLMGLDSSAPLEMNFVDIEGNKIELVHMRGKVVLIDFWSIRCGPCIQEMPHVKAMYDKYQDKGFEVIGLVADGDAEKEQVLKIIKKQNATWPQSLDKGSEAIVSYHALYNIESLPTVWLLDKEGKIVDKNARGERLEPLIRKYLGLKK